MLAKFIDEYHITPFKKYWKELAKIEIDGAEQEAMMTFTNAAAEEKAIASGEWLEVIDEEKPSLEENEYCYNRFEVIDNKIYRKWVIQKSEEEDEDV